MARPPSCPNRVSRPVILGGAFPPAAQGSRLSWVDAFRARIAEAAPDGYFVSLAGLARALLAWHAEALRV